MKVIVCEKCFNIPKITIKNKNEIQLECQNCELITSSPIDYFNRYIKKIKMMTYWLFQIAILKNMMKKQFYTASNAVNIFVRIV